MKKYITLATAGLFLLSLQGAWAQREVQPPAVPPMLEGQRPLAQPEPREPAAPKQPEAKAKAKPKTKAGKNPQKKAVVKKEGPKKAGKVAPKKSRKTLNKKKSPEAAPKQPSSPE
jgi:hypothetical protein